MKTILMRWKYLPIWWRKPPEIEFCSKIVAIFTFLTKRVEISILMQLKHTLVCLRVDYISNKVEK